MIKLIKEGKTELGIVGHAGCGHANSHLGFIQDDSGGLSAVTALLQRATGIDLEIVEINVKTGRKDAYFEVKTKSGGIGKAFARRGITAFEKRLSSYALGKQAINSQAIACEAFGRILGQGAMEVPVAFQTAVANAAMDSFLQQYPDFFLTSDEEVEGNCGKVIGARLNINGINVSVMGLTNASVGGLGPNEDIEGNVNLFGKFELMQKLGLDGLPSFVIEGKVCAQPVSSEITKPTFLIRGNEEHDNSVVAECLLKGAENLGYPTIYRPELLRRSESAMESLTKEQGEYIQELGKKFSAATTSFEKVKIAAELNRFASEDLGGTTFMSNSIHKVMGGVGCIPGTSCVLSLFIPNSQLEQEVLPTLSLDDVDRYVNLIIKGIEVLNGRKQEASVRLAEIKKQFNL